MTPKQFSGIVAFYLDLIKGNLSIKANNLAAAIFPYLIFRNEGVNWLRLIAGRNKE